MNEEVFAGIKLSLLPVLRTYVFLGLESSELLRTCRILLQVSLRRANYLRFNSKASHEFCGVFSRFLAFLVLLFATGNILLAGISVSCIIVIVGILQSTKSEWRTTHKFTLKRFFASVYSDRLVRIHLNILEPWPEPLRNPLLWRSLLCWLFPSAWAGRPALVKLSSTSWSLVYLLTMWFI